MRDETHLRGLTALAQAAVLRVGAEAEAGEGEHRVARPEALHVLPHGLNVPGQLEAEHLGPARPEQPVEQAHQERGRGAHAPIARGDRRSA